jgi:hypothetical protein
MEDLKANENWKTIAGYPCYLVSDQGRVMSLRNPKNPKILKQGTNKDGYKQVTLVSGDSYGKGKKKTLRVNRLVALAFIHNPDPSIRRDVGHWDSDPANNTVCVNDDGIVDLEKSNLYWCSPKENANNPITLQRNRDARPEAVKKTSKKVYVYDEDLNQVSAFTSTADAGRQLNTGQGNVASACAGALPRYMGRIFSYIELTDISQREAVEKAMEQQRDKNKKSMMKAVTKYYHRNREENTPAYQKWLERAKEYSRNYYYSHHDEVLIKMRERKRLERERKRQERGQA